MLEEVSARWRTSLASGEPFEMELLLRGGDGQFRWHLTRAVPLRDDTGTITRWFGTNTDIDASRRAALERTRLLESERTARLAAETASRAKDDFLSTASHELRTPLNAILGWARMLQSGKLDQSAFLRAIDIIERNATAQVRLVEDILDGSRIINGQLHLDVRPLDLTAIVNSAVDAVRTAADSKRIRLTTRLDPAAARVVGDPDRLQQVIWNLVTNAIKFTPKDGAVDVVLRRAGTDIELTVADNGEGIDPEFLPHVFDRFRQAEGSTTRRHGGLGLGLALVRHMVEAHGGTVHADSAGVGKGARFVVTLPVQAVFAGGAEAEPVRWGGAEPFVLRPVDLTGASVLVVDDEPDARDLVATVLRGRGAEVTLAGSAGEALALVANRPFSVMVSDVGMPGTDGYELIGRVRTMTGTRGAGLPAVALTAYSRDEDCRRAHDAGFNAYVSKPVEPERLVQVVADTARLAPANQAHTPSRVGPASRYAVEVRERAGPAWRSRGPSIPEQPDGAPFYRHLSLRRGHPSQRSTSSTPRTPSCWPDRTRRWRPRTVPLCVRTRSRSRPTIPVATTGSVNTRDATPFGPIAGYCSGGLTGQLSVRSATSTSSRATCPGPRSRSWKLPPATSCGSCCRSPGTRPTRALESSLRGSPRRDEIDLRKAISFGGRGAWQCGTLASRHVSTAEFRVRRREKVAPAGSGQEINGIGQFEGSLGVAAEQVTVLVAHGQQDRVTEFRELSPFGGLEINGALEGDTRGQQDHALRLIALLAQVALGCLTQFGRPAGDEEEGHLHRLSALRELEGRRQRPRRAHRLPGAESRTVRARDRTVRR